MDKYLLEILKNVNTIIIPGLGALTITDHESGEIMFMSYLKHDDGKLVSYIMENEGFEELEAKNLIAKYVREIELTVNKGGSYDMFEFGSFYKNGDDIDFKNWDKTAEKVEKKKPAPKKEEIKATAVKKPVEKAPEKENILVNEPKKEAPKKAEGAPKKEEKPAAKATPKIVTEIPPEKKKEQTILEKEEQLKHAEKLAALKKEQEVKKLPKKEKPVKEKRSSSKRGVGFWMLMGLIVLIIAGGTYFGLNYDELKQHVPFLADKEEVVTPTEEETSGDDQSSDEKSSHEAASNENEISEEEPIEDETITEEPVSEEPVEDSEELPAQSQYTGGDLPFHVIAGAFSSEENANRLGAKFTAEGYSVKVGQGRGMTLVSIKSYATREEAQQGLNELVGVAPKGWIYEWK